MQRSFNYIAHPGQRQHVAGGPQAAHPSRPFERGEKAGGDDCEGEVHSHRSGQDYQSQAGSMSSLLLFKIVLTFIICLMCVHLVDSSEPPCPICPSSTTHSYHDQANYKPLRLAGTARLIPPRDSTTFMGPVFIGTASIVGPDLGAPPQTGVFCTKHFADMRLAEANPW